MDSFLWVFEIDFKIDGVDSYEDCLDSFIQKK